MSALLFALALVSAQEKTAVEPAPAAQSVPPMADPVPEPVVATPASEPVAEVAPYPTGAPRDDYGLVSWCYGVLSGYLELHDRVLPEVTRIEKAYRRPGSSLADDMAVYADMQKESRANMKLFAQAMEAAERASLQPINVVGAAAVQKGRGTWAAAANLPTRTVAQQWMGWTLPALCPSTAATLETRAKLFGTAFNANAEPPPEAVPSSTETPPPPPAELPPLVPEPALASDPKSAPTP